MDKTRATLAPLIGEEPYELGKDAAALRDAINAQWEQLQARTDKHKAEGERLSAIDPLAFTPADAKARAKHRQEAIELLQAEVPLLKRLYEWRQIRKAERAAAFDRISAAVDDDVARVREKLAGIGFDPQAAAEAAWDDPNLRHRDKLAMEAALDAIAHQHPSIMPARKLLRTLDELRFNDQDLSDGRLKPMIDAAEAKLRALISSL